MDDDTIYEEDYLLLDEVLDLIENIGGEDKDTDIETQIYDYNNTVDVYRELEVGATIKNQEKLLELYKQAYDKSLNRTKKAISDFIQKKEKEIQLSDLPDKEKIQ